MNITYFNPRTRTLEPYTEDTLRAVLNKHRTQITSLKRSNKKLRAERAELKRQLASLRRTIARLAAKGNGAQEL